MKAVAFETHVWEIAKPFLLMLVALIIGFILADMVSGGAPMPPQDPAPVFIVSPWNGTFYAREYEGGKPFVAVGSQVQPHTVVCIVEAMRQFRVPAGVEGKIVEVLVQDNQLVTPGQPLFKVQPIRPPQDPWKAK